jgi:glycosyltransferase involved in cell wall biosynthesis
MPSTSRVSGKSSEPLESDPFVNKGGPEAGLGRPLRVLHLIADLGGGGSERIVWDIVRLTDAEKFKHRVVTIYPDYSGDFIYADRLQAHGAYKQPTVKGAGYVGKIIKALKAQRDRFPARKLLFPALRLGSSGLALSRVTKAFRQFDPDIVHVHTLPGFLPGMLMKRLFNKPLIHTVPSVFSQMADAGYGWMPKLYARLHPWVDFFFTGASREELLEIGVPASKIHEIRGGFVDLEAIAHVEAERERHYAEVRRSLDLPQDALIALSVGRLHPSKGHEFALAALPLLLDRFPNLHWVVLGEGAERSALEARARALGITSHVHLVGFQPNPSPYYAAANIYLRTPVFEAENLSSYQAMAAGLPVVGFDTGNETELIRKAGHGHLVSNRDAAALAEAVACILKLPDGGRTLGRLGAEYCRQHLDVRLTISEISSAYVDLYKSRQAGNLK